MFDFIKQNPFLWLIIFLLVVSPSFLFGAFQVIAVVVFVIIILIIIGLLVLRWKIYSFQKQASKTQGSTQSGAENHFEGERFRSSRRAASDIDVEIINLQNSKKVANDVGDYVDFEEVKEDK